MPHFEKALARLQSRLQNLPEICAVELFPGFQYTTTVEIHNKYLAWLESIEHDTRYAGAIGGRLTFLITPTSIGVFAKVHDEMTDTTFDLTDYESF